MARFEIEMDGQRFEVEAPDQQSAIQALEAYGGQDNAPQANLGYDPSLPVPGNPNFNPVANAPQPSQTFGMSQSANPNPLVGISAFGNELAAHVPIAGPALKQVGENVDAWFDNAVNRPTLNALGQQTVGPATTPQDVARSNQALSERNPELATAGAITAPMVAYYLASKIPGGAKLLGLEGTVGQRLAFGTGSQFGINTADNLAHGQDIGTALANSVIPTAAAAPFSIFGKGPIPSGERQAAAQVMERAGVPLTAGQQTGNKTLQFMESELGGGATQNFMENQGGKFTQAALAKAGIQGERATPDVLKKGLTDIGDEFDRLATKSQFPLDQRLQNEMLDIATNYSETTGIPAAGVEAVINRAAQLAAKNGGVIDGEAYKNLRSKIGELAQNADAPTAGALRDIQSVLDDAVESYIPVSEVGAWQAVRDKYRNFLVLERAATGAGPEAGLGIISPQALRQATVGVHGRRSYATGGSDFADLAHAGNVSMPKLPDSATATRAAIRNMMLGPAAITGALAGHDTGGVPGALLGGLVGTGAPYLAGRAMLTSPVVKALTGKGPLADVTRSSSPSMIARALLTGGF